MKKTARGTAPGLRGAESWTDETLPLGFRRELLDRELQTFIARKNRGQSAAPPRNGEPDDQRPAPGERNGDRPG